MVMMMVTMERGHDDLKRRRLFWNLPDGVSFAFSVERERNARKSPFSAW